MAQFYQKQMAEFVQKVFNGFAPIFIALFISFRMIFRHLIMTRTDSIIEKLEKYIKVLDNSCFMHAYLPCLDSDWEKIQGESVQIVK